MDGLKARAKTLVELAQNAGFYVAARPLRLDGKAQALATPEARRLVAALGQTLSPINDWSEAPLEAEVRNFAESQGVKLGNVAQPLRAALTGSTTSPGIFEVMRVLGRDEATGPHERFRNHRGGLNAVQHSAFAMPIGAAYGASVAPQPPFPLAKEHPNGQQIS